MGPVGGGGGRGLPAMGLLWDTDEGFLEIVPFLEGAGLGSALPTLDFLELLGGATGPKPNFARFSKNAFYFPIFFYLAFPL